MENIAVFQNLLFKPADTIKQLNTKDYSYKDVFLNVLLISFLLSFAGFVSSIFILNSDLFAALIGLVFTLVIYSILFFVFGLIFSSIFSFIAKLLGGKQSVKVLNLFYLYSTLSIPFTAIIALLIILSLLPLIGSIFGLLNLLVSLVTLYYITILIREVFEISTLKAVAVWLLPVIIFALIIFILIIFLGAALLSLILSAKPPAA
ncbi:MAG: YIP1 family protein [Candidatus Micrarchaeota archaeon]|nr:YIP1 family protein [Candidatus Micrarchaeota archaeon]